MNARRRTRVQLFAFLAVVAALFVATFTRPSRDERDVADSESVSASTDSGRHAAREERTRYSGSYSAEAASAPHAAEPAPSSALEPLDPAEHARRREERRALRAEQRARWEERKREARSSVRASALERAKGNPEQVEYLKAQFARRDEHDRVHEERREERRKNREERAAHPSAAVPPPSDAPLLGPPVIGEDGIAYDPHARVP